MVKWRSSLIAWANDAGVKVYDAANDQRITFIERPRGSPRPELLLPHLVWQVSQRSIDSVLTYRAGASALLGGFLLFPGCSKNYL